MTVLANKNYVHEVLNEQELCDLVEIANYEVTNHLCLAVPRYQSWSNMHAKYESHKAWKKLETKAAELAKSITGKGVELQSSWFNVTKTDSNFGFHEHSQPTVVFYLHGCDENGTLYKDNDVVWQEQCSNNMLGYIEPGSVHSVPPWAGKDRCTIAFAYTENHKTTKEPFMCDQMNVFAAQGYVHLNEFLDKENCAQLTDELKKLVDKGATVKDDQCPKSQAVHGAPVFDSLLEQLLPHFEQASGKRLLPTYAYARLYAPGDELKIHTDRPACEISTTLTLGFDGDVWPIFMGNENKTNASKIEMGVGDAVLYRGMDIHHWREPYKEGQWQAQVFLHYVDADGPHAEWKYDKRPKLSHHGEPDYTFWHFADAMTPEACRKLIESLEAQAQGEQAQIGMGAAGVVNKEIRDVKRVTLPAYRGIGATMVGFGMAANHQAWKFDVTHSNQTDYLKYDKDGHYHAHVDTFIKPGDPECRKLTVLVFLNDDFEGGRLFLQNGHEKIYPPQKAGTALVFPSFILHGVEPVTSGIRRSIVTWMVGPWFK